MAGSHGGIILAIYDRSPIDLLKRLNVLLGTMYHSKIFNIAVYGITWILELS